MSKYEIGMLAKSKAGHDDKKVYMILDMDDSYVYLVDGLIRTIDKPKKKKKKHVQIIESRYDISAIDDVAIKRILKEYKEEKLINEED
ncbi:MAG: KOW domain-containing RNA-binding protein [Lachnospiraceae bacterium]|nr:KOW domain-containing RNA-binding protein [Lachnospiraceae bacterium]